jgi:hypothetical protein
MRSDRTEPACLELIHAEIDGELDEHQRAALARCVLADPEVRRLRDGLRQVCASLDALAEIEPPPQLRANILAALPRQAAPSPPAHAAARRSGFAWRYAAAFAGALVAGGVLYEVGVGRGPDPAELAGTLSDSKAATVRLDYGQVTGQASLVRTDTDLSLVLHLQSGEPVDVLVASAGQTQRISSAASTVLALPGSLVAGQRVDLTFLVAGRRIGTATLAVPGPR